MGWRRAWVLALLVLVAGAGSAAAQQADVLTGRVYGEDGRPLVGARVEIMSAETEITRSVITDADGRYMLIFPDGGGRYLMRVTYLGMADVVQVVMREAEEELLLTNVRMAPQAIALRGLAVTAQRAPARAGAAGEQSTTFTADLLGRLPLPDLDPTTLALLAGGVVPTSLDSITGMMRFSVAGMSDLLNQITLDGMIVGDGMAVPELGVRAAQVTTSTFDVSRGGFAGGSVTMTTTRGNNRSSGALLYRWDDDALQIQATPMTNAFTRQNIGASWGGPLVLNRVFYNATFQLQRSANQQFALAAGGPLAGSRSGVDVDSIGRFLSILERTYGISTAGQTGAYRQLSDDIRLQTRMDWNVAQRQSTSQTLQARFNMNLNMQDSTRISTLDLAQAGGDTERNGLTGALNLTSRFGRQWTNQLNVSIGRNWSEALPFIEMPQGQVRITSEFEDSTRGTRTVVFGGNRSMPAESYSRDVQLSNDLSFLLPIGDQLHRLKVGGSVQQTRDRWRSTDNLFGTFTFSSLEAFEQNQPERYDRVLTAREAETGRYNLGVYVGDTWRVSTPLELTFGLRWDYSRVDQRPEYNARIEELFGRRTDVTPASAAWQPRVGFNYRLNQPGEPARALSGGIGMFAGRAPTSIFSTAVRQTGLSGAEQYLFCIGDAVPQPAWYDYSRNPAAVPVTCADGGQGLSPLSSRAPAVTLIDANQSSPSALRFDVGYHTQLPLRMTGQFRYQFARGSGLWSYRDINLDESRTFVLAGEDRTFFGEPGAIVASSGAVSSSASRLYPEFGNVLDVQSIGRSQSHQVTARVDGFLPRNVMFNANYTLGFARDQGGSSFAQNPTAGNPNVLESGTSTNDRRHNLNVMLAYPVRPWLDVTALMRLTSGAPFTPLVNRDVNGDGMHNDRAFIFDPTASGTDPGIGAAMNRLLATAPGRVRDCLESQFGSIAKRNSCRNGWTQSLDMRVSVHPNLPALARRVSLAVDARNVPAGLDQLVNGRNSLKGWGEGQLADANLLSVRSFDPGAQRFGYEVNEGFGQSNRGPNAFRSGFSITISGQVALGAARQGAPGGFGGFGPIAAGSGGGDHGSGAHTGGGWGGGHAAGEIHSGGRGGAGAGHADAGHAGGIGGMGAIGGLSEREVRAVVGAVQMVGPAELVARALANPLQQVLALRATLGLSEAQVSTVRALSDTLEAQLAPRRARLQRVLQTVSLAITGGGGLTPQMMQDVQAERAAAQSEITAALGKVEQELTAAQWQSLPENVRTVQSSPLLPFGGHTGGEDSLNALALIDQLLANPIPVLLELKDTLELTAEQVKEIEAVSAGLQERLSTRREDLGRRFEGTQAPQQQRQLFRQIQPELETGRREIAEALRAVERILTADQWRHVPEQIRNPSQGQQGGAVPDGTGDGGGARSKG